LIALHFSCGTITEKIRLSNVSIKMKAAIASENPTMICAAVFANLRSFFSFH
jgi:hypothetical protein